MQPHEKNGWFSTDEVHDDGRIRIEILRVPAKGLKPVVCLSREIVCARVHYLNNRSFPCNKHVACPGCKIGAEARPYGYVAVEMLDISKLFILEVTAAPYNYLRQIQRKQGTLRGSLLNCYRKPSHKKGAIYVQVERQLAESYYCSLCPDVVEILSKMWRIDQLSRRLEQAARDRPAQPRDRDTSSEQ